MEDFFEAISATNMRFDDIVDSTFSWDDAEKAIDHAWQGKQVGKVVIRM